MGRGVVVVTDEARGVTGVPPDVPVVIGVVVVVVDESGVVPGRAIGWVDSVVFWSGGTTAGPIGWVAR